MHKWYVFLACYKKDIEWRGIVHDWSKLRPSEFFPYAEHFYGKGKDISSGRDSTGYYKPTDTGDPDFDFAWLLHQKRNKHHWQWWIIVGDDGSRRALEMPEEYMLEMVCDWKGAGKAQGFTEKDECKNWYLANKDKMTLHKKTRKKVETLLGLGE